MQTGQIGFYGSYRYADRDSLEGAVARARAHLQDEELEADALVRYFVRNGTALTVNVDVTDSSEMRFAAANVFLILAHGAIDGAVESRRGPTTLDVYESGDDSDS